MFGWVSRGYLFIFPSQDLGWILPRKASGFTPWLWVAAVPRGLLSLLPPFSLWSRDQQSWEKSGKERRLLLSTVLAQPGAGALPALPWW